MTGLSNSWADLLLSATLALPTNERITNFYLAESDGHHGFLTTAAQRRDRLLAHLNRVALGDLVLVGEAAGWRGARQSGIAFTAAPAVGLPGTREASATIVQDSLELAGLAGKTLLWNALPTHPHRSGAPQTNRTPTATEIAEALDSLHIAIGGRFVVCVGRNAARAVSDVLDRAVPELRLASESAREIALRHPSFGGAQRFRTEFAICVSRWSLKA